MGMGFEIGDLEGLTKLLEIASKSKESIDKDRLSIEEQSAALLEFAAMSRREPFQPGDFVERNKFGKGTYKFPNKKQTALVLKVHEDRLQVDGEEISELCDLEIAVVVGQSNSGKPHIKTMVVDSRYYQKRGLEASPENPSDKQNVVPLKGR